MQSSAAEHITSLRPAMTQTNKGLVIEVQHEVYSHEIQDSTASDMFTAVIDRNAQVVIYTGVT